jgi:hypothetical protein
VTVSFDPETGILTAPRATIADLARFVTGAGPVDLDALGAALVEAGAGSAHEPHPRLAQGLLAVRKPIVGILLGKTGYGMPGWIGEGWFAMHVFRSLDGDEDQFVSGPADRAPHFFLELLDIGPRPRDERPEQIVVDAAALNRAVALQLGDRPSAGLLPEPLDASVAERFRDWWMATSRWPPAPERPGAFAIEAIDTDDGLWSVQRLDDGGAVVRPLAPVSAMLALGDMIPDGDLVDQSAPRLPVEDTPVAGGPVAWVAEVLADPGAAAT